MARNRKSFMPSKPRLTGTQKHLVSELDKIMVAARLDYWNILDTESDWRTTHLQLITREIIRGQVVSKYTLIDEQLGSRICHYMFDNKKFMRLWKTRKFERFNYYTIEKMSVMEKLAFVKDVYTVPKAIASNVEQINAIRNAVAHAFFPENLRAHRAKQRSPMRRMFGPHYKGIDIFTFPGFERFLSDAQNVVQVLSRVRRKKNKQVPPLPPSVRN
jgi:hypothetical protein